MANDSKEKLWNLKQLIENYPAFTEWGVRHLVRHRRIPIVKIGRRILFCPNDIKDWVEEKKIKELSK